MIATYSCRGRLKGIAGELDRNAAKSIGASGRINYLPTRKKSYDASYAYGVAHGTAVP